MGTVPVIPTLASGAVVTSAYLNSIKAANDFWALTPRCSVYASSAQSLTHNVSTAVNFDSEVYDIVQAGDTPSHDNATLNTRIFIRTSGKYEIAAQVQFASNATGLRTADVRLNAAGSPTGGSRLVLNQQGAASGGSTSVSAGPVEAPLVAGDYVEVFASQSSTIALNTVPSIGVTYLRLKLTGS